MKSIIRNQIAEIFESLANDNNIVDIPDDDVQKINEEINKEIEQLRQELYRKGKSLHTDISDIILSA